MRSKAASAPSPAQLAAIVAAVELCWPRPAPRAGPATGFDPPAAWRFAGRWWHDARHFSTVPERWGQGPVNTPGRGWRRASASSSR